VVGPFPGPCASGSYVHRAAVVSILGGVLFFHVFIRGIYLQTVMGAITISFVAFIFCLDISHAP
jgi:hypothetical protein